MDARVEDALTRAALWTEVKDKLGASGLSLSGGQQQRLCIARTVATRPEVILLDEPCSALDPISTAKIEELIDELSADYTIVIVTHNMQQARARPTSPPSCIWASWWNMARRKKFLPRRITKAEQSNILPAGSAHLFARWMGGSGPPMVSVGVKRNPPPPFRPRACPKRIGDQAEHQRHRIFSTSALSAA